MGDIIPLPDAVADLVTQAASVALEGFSHLVPFAAGHELLRQGVGELELIRMVPDLIGDQLIGMGRVRRLVFSWAGNPGVGSLHRFRDAVEHDWPRPLELEEHSHAGMSVRYVAGAAGMPFGTLRGYVGTGLERPSNTLRFVRCPFTGEQVAAVAALRPDVAVVHAQCADRSGNVLLWGVLGVQKEAVLASRRSLVTVEQVVDELPRVPGSVMLPTWTTTYVSVAAGGAAPSYADGYSERDDAFFVGWDRIARDRHTFRTWMQEHVLAATALDA